MHGDTLPRRSARPRKPSAPRRKVFAPDDDTPRVHVVVQKATSIEGASIESIQLEREFQELYDSELAVEPPLAPEKLLELAEENPIHGACINAKTVDSIGHGWEYQSRKKEKDEAEDKARATFGEEMDEKLLSLTPAFPFPEILDQAKWESDAVGWAAWEVARKGDKPEGEIVGLFALPAHTIRAVPRRGKRKGVWVQVIDEQRRYFVEFGSPLRVHRDTGKDAARGEAVARELILFRPYSYRSTYYAIPRWLAALVAAAETAAIREYNVSWFESSGMIDTLIHCSSDTGGVGVSEAKAIGDEIVAKMKEARGRGHATVITTGGPNSKVAVQPLGQARQGGREGHFGERREDLVKEILMAHQVPPYRIGWAEIGSLGGNAAREMLRAYRYGAVEPGQTLIESRLERTLFGPRGLDFAARGWRFALKDLDWEQLELELEQAVEGVRLGILSPNEGREKLGLDRKDDAALDRHYMNGTPIELSGKEEPARQTEAPKEEEKENQGEPTTKDSEDVLAKTRKKLVIERVEGERAVFTGKTLPSLRESFRGAKKKSALQSAGGAASLP